MMIAGHLITELAYHSTLSQATVRRALKGEKISSTTRKHLRKGAAEMGPSIQAKVLSVIDAEPSEEQTR